MVIVGAGLTGLWTAHSLTRTDPSLRIAVVEAAQVGYGASGRNGGWCSAIPPVDLRRVAEDHGIAAAVVFEAALRSSVAEVGERAREEGIDCGFHRGGYLHLARTPAQLDRLGGLLAAERSLGLAADDEMLDAASAAQRARVTGTLGARFTPHCAVLNPGRLVRGLAAACERAGVTIFERSPARRVEPGGVRTDGGRVDAPVVIRATEAYTSRLPGNRRTLAPIYSLMIATEPLTDDVWAEIGWSGREAINDARRLIIYAQRTDDGRIAFGGRGAPYHWGSRIADRFDHDVAVHHQLVSSLHELFPATAGAAITHRWGGPLGVPRDWHPSVGFDRGTGFGWAGGYVGDGVTASNLAGRTLAALVTGASDPLTALPWVGHRSRAWEPEPLRWLAIRGALVLTRSADDFEARTGRAAKWRSALLDRLTGG